MWHDNNTQSASVKPEQKKQHNELKARNWIIE